MDSKYNIEYNGSYYQAKCLKCGNLRKSPHRDSISRTLKNGHCIICHPRRIIDKGLIYKNDMVYADCVSCGTTCEFTRKQNALGMLSKKVCKYCSNAFEKKARYMLSTLNIVKTEDGKWLAKCPSCDKEVDYTTPASAKKLVLSDSGCRFCKAGMSFDNVKKGVLNISTYKMFIRGAKGRGFDWELDYTGMCDLYTGKCALSGVDLIDGGMTVRTWSIDRIDNNGNYSMDNVRFVHKDVNMLRGSFNDDKLLEMCINIVNNLSK